MQFLTENTNKVSPKLFRVQLLRYSRIRVLNYEFGPTEINLDKYLLQRYGVGLRHMCLAIINNAKMMIDENGEVVVYFASNFHEYVARLITFGTGKFLGSRILTRAFATI